MPRIYLEKLFYSYIIYIFVYADTLWKYKKCPCKSNAVDSNIKFCGSFLAWYYLQINTGFHVLVLNKDNAVKNNEGAFVISALRVWCE